MSNADEREISQRVWFRLVRLGARLEFAVSARLRDIGLTLPQCDMLTTLTEKEGVNQQELAKRLYITKGNISGLLDRLETAGLVERRSIEEDKRQYAVFLTRAGRASADAAIAAQRAFIDEIFEGMPISALEAFDAQLIAVRDRLREMPAEKPAVSGN